MLNYKVILDEEKLNSFINFLPCLTEDEAYYLCLFGRHKYDNNFPNTKDSGQLIRSYAFDKEDLKYKLKRLEVPFGSLQRNGTVASNECLATFITINPRSLPKANKELGLEIVRRMADGQLNFNPVGLAFTYLHKAVSRKKYVEFDYDVKDDYKGHVETIKGILPHDSFKILKTRGGIHCLVELEKTPKVNWYQELCKLPECDVRGTHMLTPIAGCTQGGFCPYFVEI